MGSWSDGPKKSPLRVCWHGQRIPPQAKSPALSSTVTGCQGAMGFLARLPGSKEGGELAPAVALSPPTSAGGARSYVPGQQITSCTAAIAKHFPLAHRHAGCWRHLSGSRCRSCRASWKTRDEESKDRPRDRYMVFLTCLTSMTAPKRSSLVRPCAVFVPSVRCRADARSMIPVGLEVWH